MSDRHDDAITVDGIAPATFTNAGDISNGNLLVARAKPPDPISAVRFNVAGTFINQATGSIFGDDHGIFIDSQGINNVINYGDISARKGPAIGFGQDSGGTIDNFGTINNGNVTFLSGSSRGIGLDTSGTVTINNHVGASIRSGPGPSPNAIIVLSGNHVINNDGLIEAHRLAIQVTGGSAVITNRGTISSRTGTAISLESSRQYSHPRHGFDSRRHRDQPGRRQSSATNGFGLRRQFHDRICRPDYGRRKLDLERRGEHDGDGRQYRRCTGRDVDPRQCGHDRQQGGADDCQWCRDGHWRGRQFRQFHRQHRR